MREVRWGRCREREWRKGRVKGERERPVMEEMGREGVEVEVRERERGPNQAPSEVEMCWMSGVLEVRKERRAVSDRGD